VKVEIDLNDILGDEYGAETIQESVKRQVVEALKKDMQRGISLKINEEVQKIINEEVLLQVKRIAPELLDNLLDVEYQPINAYGSKDGKPITLRSKFLDVLKGEFIYKKANYDSDKNAFTRAVDSLVSEEVSKFKSDFNKKIDAEYTQECLNYSVSRLKERLQIR